VDGAQETNTLVSKIARSLPQSPVRDNEQGAEIGSAPRFAWPSLGLHRFVYCDIFLLQIGGGSTTLTPVE
jgi:hypothetical protein